MTQKFSLLPIMFVLFATLAACDTAEERAEKHFQNALALIEQGDDARALVEFRNVFELEPQHKEARRAFAKVQFRQGNQRAALQSYLLLVEQYPDDQQALTRLAQIAIQENEWDSAERFGRRLESLSPDDFDAQVIAINLNYRQAILDGDSAQRTEIATRAEALYAADNTIQHLNRILFDWNVFQGRDRDSLVFLDRAIAANPDDLGLYQARLGILDGLGETPLVEKQLREMVEKFPEVPSVRQTLFSWLMQQGDVDAAEDFLRELADNSTGDESETNRVALVQFLRANKGDDAALVEIQTVLDNNPDDILFAVLQAGMQFDSGARDEAMAALEAIIAKSEPSDRIRNSKIALAKMRATTGNPVASRALIEEVLAEDATQIEALKMKSEFLVEGDKASEAMVLLRMAQESAPEDPVIYSLMAKAHERNGNRDLMGEMLARAAETSGNSPAESARLAAFLSGRDQFQPAEQALIDSLRRNPNHPALLTELGKLYIRMEKIGEASQVEQSLRGLDTPLTTQSADQLKLGILQLQNRSEDMIAMIEQLNENSNDSTRATVAIMRAHLANGNIDLARQTIEQALVETPDDLDLQFARAIFIGAEGDQIGAQAAFQSILETEPRAVNVWLSLARSFSGQGNAVEAEATIDEALVSVPNAGNLLWAKAGYLERRNDIGGAIDIYEQLYDAGSSSLIAANNLASLLTSYRQTPETVDRAYTIARRLRGLEQPAFQDTYGWIAFLKGDLEDALSHLEPAAAGLPNDPLVQYHLARLYDALERPADAAEAYGRAITVLGERDNEAMQDAEERLNAAKTAAEQ